MESIRECRRCIEYARTMWINVVVMLSGIEPRSECYIEGRHCCIVVPKMSSKHNIVLSYYYHSVPTVNVSRNRLLLNKCYCQALRSDVGKKRRCDARAVSGIFLPCTP